MRRSGCESGGEAFVAMMQAADLRDRDDLPDPAGHDRAWAGAILVERKMGARSMVVVDVPSGRAKRLNINAVLILSKLS
jgi:hypothetical protein